MYALWMFYKDQFKEVHSPDTGTWMTQVLIGSTESGLGTDIIFPARALDGRVFVTPPDGFIWEDTRGNSERMLEPEISYAFLYHEIYLEIRLKRIERAELSFTKFSISAGSITIGRHDNCCIQDPDPTISSMHGILDVDHTGQAIYTDRSSNATFLNGHKLFKTVAQVRFGDVLLLPSGLKLVFLGNMIAINRISRLAHVSLSPVPPTEAPPLRNYDGELPSLYKQYHRAPRMLLKPDTTSVEIEPPIAKQVQAQPPVWQQIGPSMTMVLPMGISTMIMMSANQNSQSALPTGLIMIGTSSMLAVMWAMINRRYRKKQDDALETHRVQLYRQYISEVEGTLRELYTREYQRLNTNFPNVGECVSLPTDDVHRLWNRMPTHSDFLHVRLGTGAVPLPSEIIVQKQKLSIIDDPLRDEPDRLKNLYSVIGDAPVTMDIRKESVVGILGTDEAALFAQGLLMQIAALHSYHDVRIAVLTNLNNRAEWAWARWLPHVFANEDREMRMVASGPAAVHNIMTYLSDVLHMRRAAEEDSEADSEDFDETKLPLPHYIIFCTDPNLPEDEPTLRQLLTNHLGMTLVMMAPTLELLPKECNYIFNVAAKPGLLHTADGDILQVDYEYPSRNILNSFSRNVAPLRVKDAAENAAIPTLVSFLDIYNARRVEDLDIWRMWNENHTYEGLRSIIGYASGSHPFVLDISDKYHGPHGLIAGTTGSGKSVMLQTYILSLALNYSPDQVQFILIDYKGGGMAAPFQKTRLPHLAGVIDNLQGSRAISRALESLNGEIHRREHIFKQHEVENINEYTQLFGSDPNEIKLPHLIIIVDEFAELKSEQPEFMNRLVSASRVGRSLGVHLILATQKPSNSVSDEIWANSRFHLCLRVQTRSDSMEMLKRPDAAYIKGMGRCFVQIGNDELFEQVQTSYSGLPYNPNEPRPEEMPQLLDESGQAVRIAKRRKRADEKKDEVSQMTAVLARIRTVADAHGLAFAKPLWLPEMPRQIYFGDMRIYADCVVRGGRYLNAADGVSFLLGMADDVATQRYIPCMVNLTEYRNLMLVGIAGTGKTTAIQSIVTSLCGSYDPAHLNIYILSLSSQTLSTLSAFPQVGDVLFDGDLVEMQRFINMIYDESVRRAKLFAQAATDSFVEYNRSMQQQKLPQVPAIVVLVDRFEQLKEAFSNNEFYTNRIHTLIREGSSRGIHFIVTALAKNEVPGKLHPFFGGIALQLRERSDYSDVLGVRYPADQAPIAAHPGRAAVVLGDANEKRIFEVQIGLGGILPDALPDAAPFISEDMSVYARAVMLDEREPLTDSARSERITAFANDLRARWQGVLPAPVPRVPEKPTFAQFAATPEFARRIREDYTLPVGYDMNSGALACVHLEKNYSMLVTGTKKSGVSNQLKVIAQVLRRRGADVHVIGGSDWKRLCGNIGASLYQTEDEIIAFIDRFVKEIPGKRQPLKAKAEQISRAQMKKQALEFRHFAILIDNAERICKGFTDVRFAKSPVQLAYDSKLEHDNAVRINEEGERAAREAAGEHTDFTPVNVPPIKTAAELAPGQNPARNIPAKIYITGVLSQMCTLAEYYNISLFMGISQAERAQLGQEPLRSLVETGRGIELGGRLTDYDPINISQAVPGWPTQARSKPLDSGNGYMLNGTGMINLRVPLIEEEE